MFAATQHPNSKFGTKSRHANPGHSISDMHTDICYCICMLCGVSTFTGASLQACMVSWPLSKLSAVVSKHI